MRRTPTAATVLVKASSDGHGRRRPSCRGGSFAPQGDGRALRDAQVGRRLAERAHTRQLEHTTYTLCVVTRTSQLHTVLYVARSQFAGAMAPERRPGDQPACGTCSLPRGLLTAAFSVAVLLLDAPLCRGARDPPGQALTAPADIAAISSSSPSSMPTRSSAAISGDGDSRPSALCPQSRRKTDAPHRLATSHRRSRKGYEGPS